MLRCLILAVAAASIGCSFQSDGTQESEVFYSLCDAKSIFATRVIRTEPQGTAPEFPTTGEFKIVEYNSRVGKLPAYVTVDPKDGRRHPAILWITGGDCNSVSDVWTAQSRTNDQTAAAYRNSGIVMMFPSLRGGNNNPGKREGFFGEVDDVLAASDYLATLPYVDANQIYLGGHSTGGTLALLVAACPNRFQAILSFGPVATADQYGGEFVYCNPSDDIEIGLSIPDGLAELYQEANLRIRGAEQGNWEAIQLMVDKNKNSNIQFFKVPGHNHFSLLAR